MGADNSNQPASQLAAKTLTVHALNADNGILALCPLPGAGGDYAGDMDHLHDWLPGLVISMTTEVEHVAVGAMDLGQKFQSMGCRWVHLPIPDFGTPTSDMLGSWPEVSAMARQTLAGGGRVLVHCKGGCGRSGMVVLRLMIEAGEEPGRAVKRLRSVRPCAVETDAQMDWALAAAVD